MVVLLKGYFLDRADIRRDHSLNWVISKCQKVRCKSILSSWIEMIPFHNVMYQAFSEKSLLNLKQAYCHIRSFTSALSSQDWLPNTIHHPNWGNLLPYLVLQLILQELSYDKRICLWVELWVLGVRFHLEILFHWKADHVHEEFSPPKVARKSESKNIVLKTKSKH